MCHLYITKPDMAIGGAEALARKLEEFVAAAKLVGVKVLTREPGFVGIGFGRQGDSEPARAAFEQAFRDGFKGAEAYGITLVRPRSAGAAQPAAAAAAA